MRRLRLIRFYQSSSQVQASAALISALILVLALSLTARANAAPDPLPVRVPSSPRVTSQRARVLQQFQATATQDDHNSSLLLVTRSNRYVLIQDVYEVESLANKLNPHQDDPVVGCYAYGLWLFYSEPSYNWDSDENSMIPGSKVEWILSTNRTIFYPFRMNVKSLRTPAGSIPVMEPSFTVFLGHNFTGPSDIETDSNYANPPYSKPKSLIITGHNPWYVYTASNFVQKTVCLVPIKNHLLISHFYAYCATRPLRHINSAHIDGCTVEFLHDDPSQEGQGPNACTKNGRQARITHVRNESGENVIIRRIPPIFMSTDEDENKINQ